MGNPVFIRTAEGVLLRFEDPATARKWLEAGRIQWTDRYLGSDQAWHPLSELLDFSRAVRPEAVVIPGQAVTEVPGTSSGAVPGETRDATSAAAVMPLRRGGEGDREGSPDGMRRTAEWAPPLEEEVSSRPVQVVPVAPKGGGTPSDAGSGSSATTRPMSMEDEGPTRAMAAEGDHREEETGGDWWASDPGGARTSVSRRLAIAVGGALLLVVVGLGVWWKLDGAGVDEGPAVPAGASEAVPETPLERARAGETDPVGVAPGALGGGAGGGVPPMSEGGDGAGGAPAVPAALVDRTDREAPSGGGRPEEEPAESRSAGAVPAGGPAQDRRPSPRVSRETEAEESLDTYDAHMDAGNRLMASRPEAAMAHFRRAAQLRPGRVEPLSRLGDLAMVQGDLTGAERYYREALRVNAQYGPTMLGMARLQARKGARDDARYWYTRYLDLHPRGSGVSEARAFLER